MINYWVFLIPYVLSDLLLVFLFFSFPSSPVFVLDFINYPCSLLYIPVVTDKSTTQHFHAFCEKVHEQGWISMRHWQLWPCWSCSSQCPGCWEWILLVCWSSASHNRSTNPGNTFLRTELGEKGCFKVWKKTLIVSCAILAFFFFFKLN